MINKYKRRTINQRGDLHDLEFVPVLEVEELIVKLIKIAVECGADEKKLMGVFGEKD